MSNSRQHASIPFHVCAIDHVVLRVRALAPMLDFYCDVLGCTLEKRQDEIGLVQLRAGSALIDLVPVTGQLGSQYPAPPDRQAPNLDHFCLRILPFDLDALRTHLTAHGVTPGDVRRRYGAEGPGPSLYVRDPEGNTVELKGVLGSTACGPAACRPAGASSRARFSP